MFATAVEARQLHAKNLLQEVEIPAVSLERDPAALSREGIR
jgi:hypothetical protein